MAGGDGRGVEDQRGAHRETSNQNLMQPNPEINVLKKSYERNIEGYFKVSPIRSLKSATLALPLPLHLLFHFPWGHHDGLMLITPRAH